MADTNNQNSFLDYAGLALFWNNIKQIIEDNKLVTATAITDLDTRVDQLEAANTDSIISKTYSELTVLRDSSQLIPGQQYRITDYTTTTIQENTQSAGHVFDIIVTADDESTLNEEARAIQHEGDTYFTDCDLNAWQIWYCLDNDATRFAWADSVNGKGVIYRMIDEWNNDVPYDFKNIMFKRYILDANNAIATNVAKDGELNAVKSRLGEMSHRIHTSLWYYGEYVTGVYPDAEAGRKYVPFGDIFYSGDGPGVLCPINEANSNWFYTFSDTSFNDNTLTGQGNVHDNVVKGNKYALVTIDGEGRYSFEEKENIYLNDIIFIRNSCYFNSFGNNCYFNSFGNNCTSNSFGNSCYSNSFGNSCYSNSFGNFYYSNSFRNDCYYNSFGNSCYSNSFGNFYYSNSFGNDCYYNSFGNDCNYNSFGNSCTSNSFGNSCYSNSFGNSCNFNSFGNSCYYNSFGNSCYSNSFGNFYYSNSFGNDCYSINFASSNSDTTKYNYYRHNHFGDRCQYILFKGAETASSAFQVQNYNFAQGLQGTSSAYLTIDGKRNRAYETYISMDTDGIVKESIIAEKLDKMIEISYNDLVTLRTNSKLIPGQQYRITDYTCTTKQTNTQSANHQFDIIVTADSENKLNEEARAIQHTNNENDYFAKCNLKAWKLWYCLDNDTTRFSWADNTNGRGVIYRMIDEFGNDCPYDFKNIQFARWELSNPVGYRNDFDYNNWQDNWFQESTKFDSLKTGFYGLSSSENEFYYGYNEETGSDKYKVVYTISGSPTYCYTFGKDTDYSINGLNYGNVIKEHKSSNKIQLNNIVFLSRNCYSNSFGNYCYSNSFGDYCYSNSFGDYCYSNSFGGSCNSNSFGNGCYSNSFGSSCYSNTSGNNCYSNSFSNNCFENSFGGSCNSNGFGDDFCFNSFGNYCYYNSFGNFCSSNSFGNYCYNNSFSDGCENNNFGNFCYSNSLGNDYDNNSFGNYCYSNSFGNNYSNNSFGNHCYNIKFVSDSDDSAFTNYYMNNHFGDGCEYILFKASETASPNNQVQNYNLSQGLKGTPSNYLTINGVRNRSFETKVAKNSAGTLKIYCEADLIL